MKKAILVVSFGTTYSDTRKVTIDKIEQRIAESFPGYEIRRAYTAHIIINVLKKRDGIIVDTPDQALAKLIDEGFGEIIVQPLHLIPGAEYDYVTEIVRYFSSNNKNINIKLGRPVLYYKGYEEDHPDDYTILAEAVKPILDTDKTVLFMGHGSMHPSNACYICMQDVFRSHSYDNVYIASVEGYPTIDTMINTLKKDNRKDIKLVPLMLVAGDHAKNDMAGDEDDSWKNLLKNNGFNVEVCLMGLGEIKEFQDIYIEHVRDVIDNKYEELGKNLKGLSI